MKTLSIWKPFHNGLRRTWQGLSSFWNVSKFDFFPTEKNLLTSLWYDYAHFRQVCPGETVYDFLDTKIRYLESVVETGKREKVAVQLWSSLLRCLQRERVRRLFIAYLESSSAEKNYRRLMEELRKASRTGIGSEVEWSRF